MDKDILNNPRYIYADILIALATVDDHVAPEEKEFLDGVFANMTLDPSTVAEMWQTPRTPDVVEKLVGEIVNPRFKNSLLKDCLLLAHADGQVTPEEHGMVTRVSELLKLDKDTIDQIHSWVDAAMAQQKLAAKLF